MLVAHLKTLFLYGTDRKWTEDVITMNEYTAGEEAYKNGYEAGYQARMNDEATHCLFTGGVVCDPKFNDCDGCGWNPNVSEERLRRICAAMGVPVPERVSGDIFPE